MGVLTRPGGTTIHWEQRGAGPRLYVAPNPLIAMPRNFEALLADLARDHRVVTWDPRGTGQSPSDGPFDLATDAADLTALIEHLGPGVTVSLGYNPAPLVVVETRPELVPAAVLVGALPSLPAAGDEPESLIGSDAVIAAARQLAETDPRALLHSWVKLGNPQLDEPQLQARVDAQAAYCPPTAGVPRIESYVGHDATRACTALGDRLWLAQWPNPMHSDRQVERVRSRLPEAHVVEVADGPMSRPDLTAAVVREATAAR